MGLSLPIRRLGANCTERGSKVHPISFLPKLAQGQKNYHCPTTFSLLGVSCSNESNSCFGQAYYQRLLSTVTLSLPLCSLSSCFVISNSVTVFKPPVFMGSCHNNNTDNKIQDRVLYHPTETGPCSNSKIWLLG